MRNLVKQSLSAVLSLSVVYLAAEAISFGSAAAETDPAVLVTEYADLWTGTLSVKTGEPVKWYVNVPEGTEPKGCGATIKIPDLGWGTDSHNKEEGHLTLTQGENFVYEFTPEAENDILFTCWMGSSCHHNYIHVTADGSYTVEKPADPTEITAERSSNAVTVQFTAPDAPEGARITGYKVLATDETGKRKKLVVTESPAVFEELDASLSYTFKVITLATSGDSAGEQEAALEASAPAETEPVQPETTAQKIVTEFADLWTGNVTFKAGEPVQWYVHVPDDAELNGCERTIKIPGLSWGTDTHNKNEGHLTLEHGDNLVYEFTPTETGDFLFTCWMGSECHYNYIHVTADGVPDPNAKTGGKKSAMTAAETTAAVTTTATATTATTAATTTATGKASAASSPKTGDSGVRLFETVLGLSLLLAAWTVWNKK